jgi:hypothetical protein
MNSEGNVTLSAAREIVTLSFERMTVSPLTHGMAGRVP